MMKINVIYLFTKNCRGTFTKVFSSFRNISYVIEGTLNYCINIW